MNHREYQQEGADLFEASIARENEAPYFTSPQITCLGRIFGSEQERREYFLGLLREALEELRTVLSVPFVSIDDTYTRLASLARWPMGDDAQLRELARRMARAASQSPRQKPVLLLDLYKDEVGFPHGDDEHILALSDPPYYTACPNPFLTDIMKEWTENRKEQDYHREPFAADVSEGKNDPIYNAHSYHTKVPHKAIMRYILHYTEPGDVVYDGFCGTGMTGVAAQLCGDRAAVESLGYKVEDDGTILQPEIDKDRKTVWKPFSRLGARKAVLNDLSPAATFIAYNYNSPADVRAFEREARRILREVEEECGWMYMTLHTAADGADKQESAALADALRSCTSVQEIRTLLSTRKTRWGTINYTVWSDVFVCPECTHEVVFWEAAVDKEEGKVLKEFHCPHCKALLTKESMDRAWVTKFDKAIGQTVRQAKQIPVLINYSMSRQRFEKQPDAFDLALIEKIEGLEIPYWFPTDRMPEGYNTQQPKISHGVTHVHHFYTKRNLWVLASYIDRIERSSLPSKLSWVTTGIDPIISRLLNYRVAGSGKPTPLKGTLYISSLYPELNVNNMFFNKSILRIKPIINRTANYSVLNTQTSDTDLHIFPNSIDYIFTDPPFGGNLMYSELNFLWEAWLNVFTNNKPEAIENKVQGKGLPEYQHLMTECFRQYYRVLKPGHWMTVEFHNSKNSVWNAIQEALQTAGFIVADVRTLDKQQGSFKQVTSANAVKQDLIISCYKPSDTLEARFQKEAGTMLGVDEFVRAHLSQLPVFVKQKGKIEIVAERQDYLLFDRMVAYHVQRGASVPMSAAEFYAWLGQRFPIRDGMYFLPEQAAEYDRKRIGEQEVQQPELFVPDEATAIQWLRQHLSEKPQTFQELHPQFMKEIAGWQKHEKPLELSDLLEQNFLCYDGISELPEQIREYLRNNHMEPSDSPRYETALKAKMKDCWYVPDPGKAGDLEKLREKALLREFDEYRSSSQKKLKVFRIEAVRAGFRRAWQNREYETIISIARRIPDDVLQEDPKLLMWYDQALTRMETKE